MEKLLSFLSNYYWAFIIITVILIFALIGYLVNKKKNEEITYKINDNSFNNQELNLNKTEINNNMSLQEMVKNNASVTKEETDTL